MIAYTTVLGRVGAVLNWRASFFSSHEEFSEGQFLKKTNALIRKSRSS